MQPRLENVARVSYRHSSMEYRRLGKSGLQVSALSFGAWVTFAQQITRETATQLMTTAFDSGVNFFDNAETYADGQAEMVMGEILKERGWPRDEWTVSSKVFFGANGEKPNQTGLSRKHVFEACHAALRRLQVDYLDLYFCHRPDPNTPIEETVCAMSDLVHQGKVLYWGTSQWSAAQITEACEIAQANGGLVPPTMEQPQYNMFTRDKVEKEFAPLYGDIGLGTTIWSPLAGGLLTGKYNEGTPPDSRISLEGYEWLRPRYEDEEARRKLGIVRQLGDLTRELDTNLPRLGIAWCLKNPHVSTAILGASKVAQLENNLQALELLPRLTLEVMDRIDTMLGNRP